MRGRIWPLSHTASQHVICLSQLGSSLTGLSHSLPRPLTLDSHTRPPHTASHSLSHSLSHRTLAHCLPWYLPRPLTLDSCTRPLTQPPMASHIASHIASHTAMRPNWVSFHVQSFSICLIWPHLTSNSKCLILRQIVCVSLSLI